MHGLVGHGLALALTLGINAALLWGLASLRAPVPPAPPPPPRPAARVVPVPQPPPPTAPPDTATPAPDAPAPAALPALNLPSPIQAPALGDPSDLALGPLGGGLAVAVGAGNAALALPTAQALVLDDSLVDAPPTPLVNPPPRYPPSARANSVEGQVVVRLLVGVGGGVEAAEVERATPAGVFDTAALAAVRRWRFQPATYEGKPVRAWARQTLTFRLR